MSFGSFPSMNCRAMAVTCALMLGPKSQEAPPAAWKTRRNAGDNFTSLFNRYSFKCRETSLEELNAGKTSTKRKSWVLKFSSLMAHSMRELYRPFLLKRDGESEASIKSKSFSPHLRISGSTSELLAALFESGSVNSEETLT